MAEHMMCGVIVCKQKTAYERRISDWSSDVCSSDLFQRLGLGLDLRLVVTLHRGFELGDRAFDAADQVAGHLVAVVLDRAARAVDQGVGLVAGGDQLLALLVLLAMRFGIVDHALDLVVRPAGTGLDPDLLPLPRTTGIESFWEIVWQYL